MSEKSIKIRYNAGEPPSDEQKEGVKATTSKAKRKQTPAQKEALEKARQALLEKKQKEKEAKAKLKEQEKDIDNVILANASRGQELRKRMAELQKELEEVGEPLVPPLTPSLVPPEDVTKDVVPPVVSPEEGVPPEDVTKEGGRGNVVPPVKVVSQIRGKNGKGRKVILIDASIFDSDEEEEEEQPVKRIRGRRPLKEPRRRADRRTRFRRDPDLVYSDDDDYEEEQPVYDEHEPEQKYGFRGMGHIPEVEEEQQSAFGTFGSSTPSALGGWLVGGLRRGAYGSEQNVRTTFDQINRGAGSRSANVQPPPPIRNRGVAMEQIKNENPLAKMIFG